MSIPRAPEGLGKAGRAFWRSVAGVYELSPPELATLGQAARVVEVLTRVDADLVDADEMTVTGSTGQMRPHPLLAASAEQRRVLDGLLRSLNLPMPGEVEGHRRAPAAQAAAQARWRGQRGEVA